MLRWVTNRIWYEIVTFTFIQNYQLLAPAQVPGTPFETLLASESPHFVRIGNEHGTFETTGSKKRESFLRGAAP